MLQDGAMKTNQQKDKSTTNNQISK